MSEDEKALEQEFIRATAKTLKSHKASIERLAEAIDKLRAQIEQVNGHINKCSAIWNINLGELGTLVNEQSKAISVLRDLVVPPDPPAGPVN